LELKGDDVGAAAVDDDVVFVVNECLRGAAAAVEVEVVDKDEDPTVAADFDEVVVEKVDEAFVFFVTVLVTSESFVTEGRFADANTVEGETEDNDARFT
jgi:hypothetical protein